MNKAKNRQWHRLVARSMPEALQLCKEHALAKRQMSVPRIADRIGTTPDSLYKYLGNGGMPARMLVAYMDVTGRHYPLQYMAHSLDKLVVDMPKGKKPNMADATHLSQFANQVIGMVMDAANGGGNPQHIADQIALLMQELAFHKLQVETLDEPQQQLI